MEGFEVFYDMRDTVRNIDTPKKGGAVGHEENRKSEIYSLVLVQESGIYLVRYSVARVMPTIIGQKREVLTAETRLR
jgi:hypothetical protein